MRLIDADALKQKYFGRRGGLIHTSDIDNAPTIDAVEVVRCKDCRWWKHNSCEGGLIDAYMQIDPEKFYCAHGERRTDENT